MEEKTKLKKDIIFDKTFFDILHQLCYYLNRSFFGMNLDIDICPYLSIRDEKTKYMIIIKSLKTNIFETVLNIDYDEYLHNIDRDEYYLDLRGRVMFYMKKVEKKINYKEYLKNPLSVFKKNKNNKFEKTNES